MITVKITVEFTNGVETRLADLRVKAASWKYVQRRRKIKVFGAEHFGFDKRVDDMTVGRFHPGQLILEERNQQPPESESSVVVVVESPHKEEYERRQPLVRSREKLMRNVALLCGFYLPKQQADIVICSPIQWQASLADCYVFTRNEEPQDLLKTVRDNVWEHIWNRHENDPHREEGLYPAREDFISRVRKHNPLLIVNACTANLRHHVQTELTRLDGVPVVDAVHPSCWCMLNET